MTRSPVTIRNIVALPRAASSSKNVAATLVAIVALGCGANSEIVPEENQRRAEERYGEQQQMMQGLNQTPSEQAGVRHENATKPVEPAGREDPADADGK